MSNPINGMTRAASALRYWERRQEVVANNLANAATDGFKAERVFARLVGDAVTTVDAGTDLRAGALDPTGAPLDLALQGDGFFVVETAAGERLSRGGSFRLDEEGKIVDANGNALLGEGGIIIPGDGDIEIDGAGVLRVKGEEIARLRVESLPPGTALTHDGANLYLPDPAREDVAAELRGVRQGMIEESNVSSIESLVDMIAIQRAYGAVQKAVVTLDGIRDTIANDIGKPV